MIAVAIFCSDRNFATSFCANFVISKRSCCPEMFFFIIWKIGSVPKTNEECTISLPPTVSLSRFTTYRNKLRAYIVLYRLLTASNTLRNRSWYVSPQPMELWEFQLEERRSIPWAVARYRKGRTENPDSCSNCVMLGYPVYIDDQHSKKHLDIVNSIFSLSGCILKPMFVCKIWIIGTPSIHIKFIVISWVNWKFYGGMTALNRSGNELCFLQFSHDITVSCNRFSDWRICRVRISPAQKITTFVGTWLKEE